MLGLPSSAGPPGRSQPALVLWCAQGGQQGWLPLPSSLLCWGRALSAWCRAPAPDCLPWDPGELGDTLPHPAFPLCPPMSRASGKGLRVHPSIAATCWQPQHKPTESKRLFCWGVRGGGEHAGLMPAAPLTISPWLSVLAGRCQPAGEGQQHQCVRQRARGATTPGV